MDLSVEAEAFGAEVVFSGLEVPTVVGALVKDIASAAALKVPAIGDKRTGDYLEGMARTAKAVTDRPVFGSCIGPFSLAGRLLEVNEALMMTRCKSEILRAVLEKCTAFLLGYASAIKRSGVNGIIMAEPLAGLLSPASCNPARPTRWSRRRLRCWRKCALMAISCCPPGATSRHARRSPISTGSSTHCPASTAK
jgi:uroporphyrinogen decarboxylase